MQFDCWNAFETHKFHGSEDVNQTQIWLVSTLILWWWNSNWFIQYYKSKTFIASLFEIYQLQPATSAFFMLICIWPFYKLSFLFTLVSPNEKITQKVSSNIGREEARMSLLKNKRMSLNYFACEQKRTLLFIVRQ